MTLFGKYLKKVKAHQSKIAEIIGMQSKRISLLSTDNNTKPYAEEFYKIVYLANLQAGLGEESFKYAVDEIFPNRLQVDLLDEFKDLSPEGYFFKKYTQKQTDIEHSLGIANGKISKYFGDKSKRALAIEIIAFADGMGFDELETFKDIYGPINETQSIALPNPAILNERLDKIYQYLEAYNQLDVTNMVVNMSSTIVFLNMENNKSTLRVDGIDEFKLQAIEAISKYTKRQQTIISLTHKRNSTEILVDYNAIVATDSPHGLKKGDTINFQGKSIFEFSPGGKITKLTDVS